MSFFKKEQALYGILLGIISIMHNAPLHIQPRKHYNKSRQIIMSKTAFCFIKKQRMFLGTFSRLRRSLATSTLSAAVRILAERFLLYRKAISCKAKKRLQTLWSTALSYIPSKPYTRNSTSSYLSPSWLCPRPISISQLHVLPHFHL